MPFIGAFELGRMDGFRPHDTRSGTGVGAGEGRYAIIVRRCHGFSSFVRLFLDPGGFLLRCRCYRHVLFTRHSLPRVCKQLLRQKISNSDGKSHLNRNNSINTLKRVETFVTGNVAKHKS